MGADWAKIVIGAKRFSSGVGGGDQVGDDHEERDFGDEGDRFLSKRLGELERRLARAEDSLRPERPASEPTKSDAATFFLCRDTCVSLNASMTSEARLEARPDPGRRLGERGEDCERNAAAEAGRCKRVEARFFRSRSVVMRGEGE